MDHTLTKHRHKGVRVERVNVDFWTGKRHCHLKTSFPTWRSLEGLRPSTPASHLRAVGHETRPVGEYEGPCGRTRSRGRGSRPPLLCRGAVRAAVGGVQ